MSVDRLCVFYSRSVDKIAIAIKDNQILPNEFFIHFKTFVMHGLPNLQSNEYLPFLKYIVMLTKHEDYDIRLKYDEKQQEF